MLSSIFKHPWTLAALAAVLIPLIIELLFRLHRRRVDLPTIRWLLKHKDQKKIKRQNRLLILIRSLVIFFLVLALSRPIIGKGLFGGVRKRRVCVLIDSTTSMAQRVGGTQAFDLARERAETLIQGLGSGTQVAVAAFGNEARQVVEPGRADTEDQDLLAAADALSNLPPPGGSASAGEALALALKTLADDPDVDNEVYVFSDFQRQTWLSGRAAAPLMKEVTARADVFLVDVAPATAFNLVVTRLEPVEPIATVGMPVEFRATVSGFGRRQAPEAAAPQAPTVTFFADGKKKPSVPLDESRAATPAAAGTQPTAGASVPTVTWSLPFRHTFTKPGEHLVEVEVSGDQNALDNRRRCLISVPTEQRVLVFDPTTPIRAPAEDKRALKTYFLQQAISPEQPAGYDKVSHFAADVYHPAEAASLNLNHYRAVVLAGLTEWPKALIENCEVYVRDGGALIIFLDEDLNRFDFNQRFVKGGEGLMPVLLEAPVSAPAGPASDVAGSTTQPADVTLSLGTAPHAALAIFSQAASPVRPQVRRYVPMSVAEGATGQVHVVAAFSNGAPAILERRYGRGRVVLFNLTADARWTDLPALTQFVPLVQEMLRYLAGHLDRAVNLEVGDVYTTRVLKSSQHLRLICPDGRKERLSPRPAARDAGAGWQVSYVPQQPGVYRIDARRGEVSRSRFAVNLPAVEADPSRLSKSDLVGAIGGAPFTWVRPDQSLAALVARRYSVVEAAVMLLWLVAALLAVESLLAALFGRRRGLVSLRRAAGQAT